MTWKDKHKWYGKWMNWSKNGRGWNLKKIAKIERKIMKIGFPIVKNSHQKENQYRLVVAWWVHGWSEVVGRIFIIEFWGRGKKRWKVKLSRNCWVFWEYFEEIILKRILICRKSEILEEQWKSEIEKSEEKVGKLVSVEMKRGVLGVSWREAIRYSFYRRFKR